MKKAIIIGATSGIGLQVSRLFVGRGWSVGLAGRRHDLLQQIQQEAPEQIAIQALDVQQADAPQQLQQLIDLVGGMDLFLLCAGIGWQNPGLDTDIELQTARTNVEGFIRMTDTAYHYYKERRQQGHIAVISSIAGTKGLGAAPAYSATKRFQNTYLEALAQLAHMQHLPITFTDIRPGFVDTDLLKGGHYPMLMHPQKVAQRIVKALERKKSVVTIDTRYRLLVFFWRLIPRWLWVRMNIRNH